MAASELPKNALAGPAVKEAESRSSGVRIVPVQRFPFKGFTPVHGTRSASPGTQCSPQKTTGIYGGYIPPAGGSFASSRPVQPMTNRMDSKYEKYCRYPPKCSPNKSDWSFTGMPTWLSEGSTTIDGDSTSLYLTERIDLIKAQRSTPSQVPRPRRKIAEDAQTMSEPPHAITRSAPNAPAIDTNPYQAHRALLGQSTSLGGMATNRFATDPRPTVPADKPRRQTDLLEVPNSSLRIDVTIPGLQPRDADMARISLDDFDPLESGSGPLCSTTGSEDFRPLALESATTPRLAERARHGGHLRGSDIFLGRSTRRTEVLDIVRNVAIWVLVLFGTGTIMSGVVATILLRNGSYMFTGSMLGSVLTTVGLLLAIYCADGAEKQLRLIGHRCNYN